MSRRNSAEQDLEKMVSENIFGVLEQRRKVHKVLMVKHLEWNNERRKLTVKLEGLRQQANNIRGRSNAVHGRPLQQENGAGGPNSTGTGRVLFTTDIVRELDIELNKAEEENLFVNPILCYARFEDLLVGKNCVFIIVITSL
ncbi:uncharacterized protein LOC144745958 [Ciona intestinalis]